MGINTWVIKKIRKDYKNAFSFAIPEELKLQKHVAVEDAQHFLKKKPEYVKTVHQFKNYIVKCIVQNRMRRAGDLKSPHFTVIFDKWTPDAKAIVTHSTRDKGIQPYEYSVDVPVIDENDPHKAQPALSSEKEWRRYTANRELVRRELYPIIYNAFIDEKYYTPDPGETLILHGLPGYRVMERRKDVSLDLHPDYIYSEGSPVLRPRERIRPEHEV